MKNLLAKVEVLLGYFVGLLMFAIVADVSWQVVTRFVMSEPSSYTEEVARFLLIWIGLLGAAYAYRKHAHLGLDIVTRSLNAPTAAAVQKITDGVCLLFALAVMVVGGANLMLITLELDQISAALQIPIGFVYSVLPISGCLIMLFALERLLTPYTSLPENISTAEE
ncbi:TRAP transporter, DctQ-like membrane protein [Teredinibacter turnerae T7901]|uniref:TRAP transporter small permease protein n=1 Tax=Teredinibacter turnerae (strain ATCC 39867 / T7901) TaxID=377629 RepID=C5BQ46_TERTT|nr:TRAP transporter small permease [Teredinibacter turnerae]ACR13292.1 TRAP transporter, DctQ-like membrane protein [Teredinibacter turnerae T7901]